MYYIIISLLIGINFIILPLNGVTLWSAQQLWCQGIIILGLFYSLFENGKIIKFKNKPLMLLGGWIVFQSLFTIYQLHSKLGAYNFDIAIYTPLLNFICIVILYKLIVEYLDKVKIVKILNIMRYTIIITLFMCTLQYFDIAQFFKFIGKEGTQYLRWHNNLVVGFIGNGTHLSGFLASSIPIFLYFRKRVDYLALGLMILILCNSGTTIGDPSISGFVIAVILTLYLFKDNFKFLFVFFVLFCIFCFFTVHYIPEKFFSPTGRIITWTYFFNKLFLKSPSPITGLGLGSIFQIGLKLDSTFRPVVKGVRHLHFELLQFMIELGIIGAVLIINWIKHFFSIRAQSRLELTLKAMVLGFIVSCFFNYPAHLWLPSTWAMFAYASLICIKNEGILCQSLVEKK